MASIISALNASRSALVTASLWFSTISLSNVKYSRVEPPMLSNVTITNLLESFRKYGGLTEPGGILRESRSPSLSMKLNPLTGCCLGM